MEASTVLDGQLVTLTGRLDVTGAATARDALHTAIATGTGPLIVDLAGVELLDATGLGVLVGSHRRARLAGRRLVLRDASPRVARLLWLIRIDRIITVDRSPTAA
jgi:anti-sigma B factor antagonist